jgi:hypothetical protein
MAVLFKFCNIHSVPFKFCNTYSVPFKVLQYLFRSVQSSAIPIPFRSKFCNTYSVPFKFCNTHSVPFKFCNTHSVQSKYCVSLLCMHFVGFCLVQACMPSSIRLST